MLVGLQVCCVTKWLTGRAPDDEYVLRRLEVFIQRKAKVLGGDSSRVTCYNVNNTWPSTTWIRTFPLRCRILTNWGRAQGFESLRIYRVENRGFLPKSVWCW